MPLKDPDTAKALVKGLVDAIQNPAFVVSPTIGTVASNKLARNIQSKDLLHSTWNDGDIIESNGKQYRVVGKKLNHKTDCILFELHDITHAADRMKYAGSILDKAMGGAF
jgi:hypothetical protein